MIAISYAGLPPAVASVHVLSWRDGRIPTESDAPASISIEAQAARVECATGAVLVVAFTRNDGAYLLDGPLVCPAMDAERRLDPAWRRTVRVRAPPGVPVRPDVNWLPARDDVGGWPRCAWTGLTTECWGMALDARGALVFADNGRVWWTLVSAAPVADFREASWARLIRVSDGGHSGKTIVTIARAVTAAGREVSLRLQTALVADAHAVSIAADAVWVYGEQVPASAWIELRAEHGGRKYLPLEDVAQAPPSLPLWVALEEPRTLDGQTRGPDDPVAGVTVTLFRLLDPPAQRDSRHQPRRVFADETIADAAGQFHFDALGDADYEIVAWDPRLGRGIASVARGETSVTVRLQSAGQVRGRVLAGGNPLAGVDVMSVPDPAAFAQAADLTDVKGGDGRTGADGRFLVSLAAGGGGELRVGGGPYPVRRFPLPRASLSVLDLGDIDLGAPIDVTIVLDRDPGCDIRATGPVGRSGLQVLAGSRAGPGLFRFSFPEEGTWEVHLACGHAEHPLVPALVSITQANSGKEVRLEVR